MLDPEQVGQLLASQSRCEQHQKESAVQLARLEGAVAELAKTNERVRGAAIVTRIIAGFAVAIVLSVAGWAGAQLLSDRDHITAADVRIDQVARDVEQHEAYGQEIRRQVSQLSGDMRSLETSIDSLRSSHEEMRREVLEAVRRHR